MYDIYLMDLECREFMEKIQGSAANPWGRSQPTPDVDMVDCKHMKCFRFNCCSLKILFSLPSTRNGIPSHCYREGKQWEE